MPFENEDKIPFKDLPVCDQVEVIDTLAGKYDDREVYEYNPIPVKCVANLGKVYLDCPYKVIRKDIVVEVPLYKGSNHIYSACAEYANVIEKLPAGKYKLVPIED